MSVATRFVRLWYNELLGRPGTTALAAISKGRKHPQEPGPEESEPAEPPARTSCWCRAPSRPRGARRGAQHPRQRAAASLGGFPCRGRSPRRRCCRAFGIFCLASFPGPCAKVLQLKKRMRPGTAARFQAPGRKGQRWWGSPRTEGLTPLKGDQLSYWWLDPQSIFQR